MTDFFATPTNITSFMDLMAYNNSITNDMFGVAIIFILFSISFITMHGFGNRVSITGSLWFCSLISIFLWTMQLVSDNVMVVLTVLTALATLFLFRTREN